ncbi:MAG: hypothetical protein ACE14Q_05485 [Acidobacteriota bacterium]|nr:hypothetical protein [Thermoanaerobaculaceae bacterium]
MLKKNFFIAVLTVLFAFPIFCSLDYLFEDYFLSAKKCLQAFDENYRENCMWGNVETLKNALNQKSERMKESSFKIYCCSFFRNEGRRILSVNDPFSVEKTGDYVLTIVNGNPLDKKSKAKIVKLSLWDGKKSQRIFEERDLPAQEIITSVVKLEKEKNYSLILEEIEPIPAYLTIIVSDKKID